jgi:FimV-like protein
MTDLAVDILGPLRVSRAGAAVQLGALRQQALLALLALHPGEAVAADRLVEDLWDGAPPATAPKIVQIYVSELRKALGRDAIVTRGGGYALELEPERIDGRRFEQLAASGAHREALDLWRGHALADFRYERWAQAEAQRLEELRVAVLEERIEADLAAGRHAALAAELEGLVAEHPLRERLRGQQILALYRSGRQAEALAAYREARRVLVEELGIEPSQQLRRLEQAILAQDSSLDEATPAPELPQRKTVTALWVDTGAATDPEAHSPELEDAAAAIERHGGSVVRHGGGVTGIFGIPIVHEDDALRAVRAADELRAAGVVVATGEVVATEGAAADAVRALRPAAAAQPGEVILDETTERLVRTARRPLDAQLVGRHHELALLRDAFARVERDSTCALVTVLGPAGIGKSRLAAELAGEIAGRATVLAGRCPPYGEGITFRPLAEIVDAAGDLAVHLEGEPDAALVADRLDAGSAAPPQDVFWAARRLFEAIARRGPLVLVWDDLHWAEPTLLDLVDHLASLVRDVPLLLVALARPDLLDARPHWGGGKLNATTTLLEPLSENDSEALVQEISSGLPTTIGARIVAAAEGNPLFLEQMVAHARDEPEGETAVPPTISALLAARLDRLSAAERSALQRAAVVGREFEAGAVAALAEQDPRPALDALAHKDLIRHAVRGNGTFRFRHALIRDAAYGSLPKRTRGELHERFAATLDAAGEHDELVGFHLESAYRYGEELAAPDAGLAARAAERLSAAGRRAAGREDTSAAAALLARAAALLLDGSPERLALLPELADAYRALGDFDRARALLDEALEASDERVVWRARCARIGLLLRTEMELRPDELLAEADQAIAVFERLGDERGLALSWSFRGWVPWLQGQAGATAAAAQESIVHARGVGDPLTENRGLRLLLGAALWGPAPVEEGLHLCDEILERGGAYGRITHATALRARAGFEAMAGNTGTARDLVRQERALLEELGATLILAHAAEVYALVELLGGDPVAAAGEARRSFEVVASELAGPTMAAIAARALVEAGGADEEALELASVARERTPSEDLTTQVQWRGPMARLLARRGEQAEAERLAREGVELAARTDFLSLQGDAWADLAHVLPEPGEAIEQALAAYGRKGNAAAAERLSAAFR